MRADLLTEFVESLPCLVLGHRGIEAVAIGGSADAAARDDNSDLDLFVYCSDEALGSSIGYLNAAVLSSISGALMHGPELRDAFGVGFRFEVTGQVILEIFYLSPSLWTPHPSDAKAQFLFKRVDAKFDWPTRLVQLKTDRVASDAYVVRYLKHTLPTLFGKARKYVRRGEALGATMSLIKVVAILLSLRLYIDEEILFDPDFSLRKLGGLQNRELAARTFASFRQAFEEPALSEQALLDEATDAIMQMPQRMGGACLTELLGRLQSRRRLQIGCGE